jgi:uncharacterized protein YbaP (TraB family)
MISARRIEIRFGWLISALLVLVSLTSVHASELDSDVFWKISKGGKTSYAFGILHAATFSDVPAVVLNQLRSSRIFMRESIMEDGVGDTPAKLLAARTTQSVYRILSPGAAKKLKIFWSQVPRDFIADIEFFKPGAVLYFLTQSLWALDQGVKKNIIEGKALEFVTPKTVTEVAGRSLDALISDVVKNAGIPYRSFETPGTTLGFYADNIDAATLSRYIMKHVPSMPAMDLLKVTQIEKLPLEWRRVYEQRKLQQQRLDELANLVNQRYAKADGRGALGAYMEKFSINNSIAEDLESLRPKVLRHKLWMESVLEQLEKGDVFIGTGLGHLLSRGVYPNEPSLIDLLRQNGYLVTAVPICEVILSNKTETSTSP